VRHARTPQRSFYTEGRSRSHLVDSDKVQIVTLERPVATANCGKLYAHALQSMLGGFWTDGMFNLYCVRTKSSQNVTMPTVEEIPKLPSGATWLKADLHVHTSASPDIHDKWKNSTPEDVVRIALEKKLDVIAVTDHNTAAGCDPIRMASKGTRLVVFPGVEISTHQGHLLAIFDPSVDGKQIEDLLVSLGIARADFGSLEAASPKGIVEAAAEIEAAGGVAIAAHIEGERGFLKVIKVGAERQRAYAAPNLRALEITDASLRERYQAGTVSGYERRMACIQASDCWPKGADRHHLDGMATRFSMLKMDERSLSGLKLALIDPEMRVRLPNDDPEPPHNPIIGMWVTGGFLNGQRFRFNSNVNCLIGDTGAGKSVALELLRFGLDQRARVKQIRDETDSLLSEQLGKLGTVHILLAKGDTLYLVERTWGTPPGAPTVQRLGPAGAESLESELNMPLFFPIKAFSQSEIIEFARSSEVRLSLTDDLIDSSAELTDVEDTKVGLRKNAGEIGAEEAKRQNIQREIGELSTLIEARTEVDKVLKDPRITQHQFWYRERTLLSQAASRLNPLSERLGETFAPLRTAIPAKDGIDRLPNQDLILEMLALYKEWRTYVDGLQSQASSKLEDICERLAALQGRWDRRFSTAEQEYRELLASMDKDGIGLSALSKRREQLDAQIEKLQQRKQELDTEIIPKLARLEREREQLLIRLQAARNAITAKREAKAAELSGKLNHRVRLNVHARANTSEFRTNLERISQGSRLYAADLDLLAKRHPIPLVKGLFDQSFASIAKQTSVEEAKLKRLWETILERDRLNDLYELQLAEVADVIEVMLKIDNGEYKALEKLSHGQKCMVVLMISLAEGDFPLLVDQPEDALHAPGIEEGIVATLRSRRGGRQCIFGTRNANIIVSADAEQIIALKADSQHGEIAGTGALDRFDHRRLVIYHVEGGEAAFQRRQTKYTLRPA
jgi:histidinol phosphatase-like PHP family hydrolase